MGFDADALGDVIFTAFKQSSPVYKQALMALDALRKSSGRETAIPAATPAPAGGAGLSPTTLHIRRPEDF